jgi:hypothetical protein
MHQTNLNVGDLVETEVNFGSNTIDPFMKDNKVCFLVLEKINFTLPQFEDEKWFYCIPQFALNDKGAQVLKTARESGYPHNRTGFWMLNEIDCKKISNIEST